MSELPIVTSCDGCGACCRGRSVPPFTGPDDPEFLSLPPELREPLYRLLCDQSRVDTGDSACVWFDRQTLQCGHYEHRPTPCREFERGAYYCLTYRRNWQVG